MKEDPRNIGFVCPDHTPKPDPQYFNKPFDWFNGKFCKLGFPTGRMDAPHFEFMWVKVEGHEEIEGKQMLVGKLNNDPVYVDDYQDGDGVAFERHEICDVT